MYQVLYSIAALVRVLWQTRTMPCSWNATELNIDRETETHHYDEAFKYCIKCLSALCAPSTQTVDDVILEYLYSAELGSTHSTKRMYANCVSMLTKPNVHCLNELHYQCMFVWLHLAWCGNCRWSELINVLNARYTFRIIRMFINL